MSRRVIIVGAGPGGLASAMLLAKAGADVTVLEKQPHVGGRTSLIVADGYKFDLGPTFFLYPQILQEIFQAVGRDLFKEVPMTRLDPQNRLVFGAGGELNATSDLERMVAEIAKLSPADGERSFIRQPVAVRLCWRGEKNVNLVLDLGGGQRPGFGGVQGNALWIRVRAIQGRARRRQV